MFLPELLRYPSPEVVTMNISPLEKLELYETFEKVIKSNPRPSVIGNSIVRMLIFVHRMNHLKERGCTVCHLHDLLYVAARLMVNFRLRKESTVLDLLGDIYACEGSFHRLFNGALYRFVGVLNNGMSSEFQSRRESIRALEFFLRSTKKYGMMFYHTGRFLPMADIPLNNGKSPLAVARVESGWKVFCLLRKYAASTGP